MKVIKAGDVQKGLDLMKREYEIALDGLARQIADAQGKLASGRVSTHDGFNLSAKAGELQELAAKIGFAENMIRFSEEAPCGK